MKKHTLVFRLTISLFFFSTVFLTNKTYANITNAEKSRISHQAAKLQIPFILNQGQTDEDVKFYAKTFSGTIFVTKHGEIVYALPDSEKAIAIKEEFVEAKISNINGEEKSITKVSYFKGSDQSNWSSNISTFNIVNLGEIYEGIELKLKAHGNNVEKLFFIKPENNPEAIRISLKGADELNVNENGELEVKTELGTIKFTKPVAYQVDKIPSPHNAGEGKGEGNKKYIDAAYVVNGNEYGFKIGDYDRTKELVIDPLLASTFLDGGNITSIAIDQSGNVYVAGYTSSSDFPTTPGAYDITYNNGVSDAFISKFDNTLSNLLASTFLGGGSYYVYDEARSITIDASGNVFVTGYTGSSDFPTTPGVYDNSRNGYYYTIEAFISKFNNDLTSLLASTFLGGNNDDVAYSIAIDTGWNIYVTGLTYSSNFPTTSGAYDTTYIYGASDGFISKFNNDLTSLLASTFHGDNPNSIAIDTEGKVFVAGGGNISKFDSNLSETLYILSVTKSGTGSGAVTSSPSGINCGSDCTESYASGTTVTLTATPGTGSTFPGWSGDADCSDGVVTMDADKTCTATFTHNPYTLSVKKTGSGDGVVTSNPSGINCGNSCSASYAPGTVVTLTTAPYNGSVFVSWKGDPDCADGVVTVDSIKTCTALFKK